MYVVIKYKLSQMIKEIFQKRDKQEIEQNREDISKLIFSNELKRLSNLFWDFLGKNEGKYNSELKVIDYNWRFFVLTMDDAKKLRFLVDSYKMGNCNQEEFNKEFKKVLSRR